MSEQRCEKFAVWLPILDDQNRRHDQIGGRAERPLSPAQGLTFAGGSEQVLCLEADASDRR
jgi:hypothetical protein